MQHFNSILELMDYIHHVKVTALSNLIESMRKHGCIDTGYNPKSDAYEDVLKFRNVAVVLRSMDFSHIPMPSPMPRITPLHRGFAVHRGKRSVYRFEDVASLAAALPRLRKGALPVFIENKTTGRVVVRAPLSCFHEKHKAAA